MGSFAHSSEVRFEETIDWHSNDVIKRYYYYYPVCNSLPLVKDLLTFLAVHQVII